MIKKRPKAIPQLKVTCTSTDCDNGLHCFKQKQRKAGPHGPCRECRADLVDWDRMHARDLNDIKHTLSALKQERIRHHYFHKEPTQYAINYALRAGSKELEERVRRRVKQALAKTAPSRDGRQTPISGRNPIHDAQHATATCCRRCFEYWYGVPMGVALTAREQDYACELIIRVLREQFPDLPEKGQSVPSIRHTR